MTKVCFCGLSIKSCLYAKKKESMVSSQYSVFLLRMSYQEKDDKNENIFTPQKCNFVMEM